MPDNEYMKQHRQIKVSANGEVIKVSQNDSRAAASKSGSSAVAGKKTPKVSPGKQGGNSHGNSASKSSKSTGSRSKSSGKASGNSRSRSSGKASGSSSKRTGSGTSKSGGKSKTSGSATGKSTSRKSGSGSRSAVVRGEKQPRSRSGSDRSSSRKEIFIDHERANSAGERELHSTEYARQLARRRRLRAYNKNRRLFAALTYIAIAVAVIVVAVVMSTTVLFNITDIVYELDQGLPYTEGDIAQHCSLELGQNIFTAHMSDISNDITSALPYVENCTIKRKLPSTVVIKVTAAEIMGVARGEFGQFFVLSTAGRTLEAVESVSASDVPVLNGIVVVSASVGEPAVVADPAHMQAAEEVMKALDSYGIKVDELTVKSDGTITALYNGRLELLIGTPSNLDSKLAIAAEIINGGKIATNEAGTLDLTIYGRGIFRPDYLNVTTSAETTTSTTTAD